jgi:hypothetical protein
MITYTYKSQGFERDDIELVKMRSVSSSYFPFAARLRFCAIEIFLRAAADNLLRPTLAPRFAPFSKASIRCSIFASSVISE